MTKREFTEQVYLRCAGLMSFSARAALNSNMCGIFVDELIEQDSDEGSRSGTKRVLGEDLYNELQKFKTKN